METAIATGQWMRCVNDACLYLQEQQDRLVSPYKLGQYERFDIDQDSGLLVFSDAGVPKVNTRVQYVGTFSTQSSTWLWSWANSSIQDNMKTDMHRVITFGEENGYEMLQKEKFRAEPEDGWMMTAVTAQLLGAIGAYRAPFRNGFAYLVIMQIESANIIT